MASRQLLGRAGVRNPASFSRCFAGRSVTTRFPKKTAWIGTLPCRGIATQAQSTVAEAASTSSSTFDMLSGGVQGGGGALSSSFFSPLVPYIDQMPTWFGMAQDAPYAYAISIVISTLILRSAITLPISIWQRGRTRRMVELVGPRWEEIKHDLPIEVARRCRVQRKNHDAYKTMLQAELKAQLKALVRQHKCAPIPTLAIPLIVNIPLFIVVSLTLRTALLSNGTMIGAETIPWWSPPSDLMAKFEESAKILQARGIEGEALRKLTVMQGPTLSEVDKTMATPIGLGMLTLINVELGQWLRRPMIEGGAGIHDDKTANEKQNLTDRQQRAKDKRKSVAELRSTILGNTLRAASIAFVVVASQAPTGLVIYWLSSASYTLVQNAIFAQIDKRRASRLK